MTQTKSLSIFKEEISVKDFLKSVLGLSRSQIKNLLFKKKYLDKILKPKDEVFFSENILNNNHISPIYKGPNIPIIYEDESFIVVNKPNSIHGHPLAYNDCSNILSFIRSTRNLKQLSYASLNKERGLIYRLDAVTSGVLVFCKKENLAYEIRQNFNQIVTEKTYLAIVQGECHLKGEFSHYFKYSGIKSSKARVSADGDGVLAQLYAERISYNIEKDLSLVKINLKTGVRHQVRAQLSYLGFPILGDELYSGMKERRVYLHAYIYSIEEKINKKAKFICADAELFGDFFDLNSIL